MVPCGHLKKRWMAAVEESSALSCLPGDSVLRWVQDGLSGAMERLSGVSSGQKGSVRMHMSEFIPRAWLTPGVCISAKEMLLGQTWVCLLHAPPWRRRWEQGKPVTMLLQTTVFLYVIPKQDCGSLCSPSGLLRSITNYWNGDLKILLISFSIYFE